MIHIQINLRLLTPPTPQIAWYVNSRYWTEDMQQESRPDLKQDHYITDATAET